MRFERAVRADKYMHTSGSTMYVLSGQRAREKEQAKAAADSPLAEGRRRRISKHAPTLFLVNSSSKLNYPEPKQGRTPLEDEGCPRMIDEEPQETKERNSLMLGN